MLNLFLLGATLVGLAGIQLQNVSSVLLAPARDRVLADARLLALDLSQASKDVRDEVLDKFAQKRSVQVVLFNTQGQRVAGPRMPVPPVVHARAIQHDLTESFFVTTRNPTQYWVGVRIPIGSLEGGEPVPGVLIFVSNSLLSAPYFVDVPLVGLILLVVVLIAIVCWLPLIRRLTRGFSEVTSAAEQIAEGHFDVHVASNKMDELGQLGDSVNRMAARLSGFVQGQKGFLGSIAHELCSPIARISVALGILEQRTDGKHDELVRDLREEVDYMSALVGELLSFSKAGMQPAEVQRIPVNVAETVRRAVARESRESETVEVSVDEGLSVLADPDFLFRSLSNLIRNSVRYAGDSGPIRIFAETGQGVVRITVADSGPGLPEEELEEIFAPFHRPESARTRETGGSGLGLAIVKSCIEVCKGTVKCRNLEPKGLAVEIQLASVL